LKIREVLSRRSDLSTFLVHLTRDWTDEEEDYFQSARDAFAQIIEQRRLLAVSPMGFAQEQDDPADTAKQSQRVVSFTETPLEYTHAMFVEIEDRERRIKLRPYGLALTKVIARQRAVNPVWYVDMTPAGHEWLAHQIWSLRDTAVATAAFHEQPIARLLPFVDWMGGPFPLTGKAKEFWWEREWRHQGHFELAPIWSKIIWLCPAEEHDEFKGHVNAATIAGEIASDTFIDPSWGLEEIIAHLAGLPMSDVSVFAAAEAPDDTAEPPPQL
jgi:hypothetical protein